MRKTIESSNFFDIYQNTFKILQIKLNVNFINELTQRAL